MRRALVLLILSICSCGAIPPGPTETPPPNIEANEYAVYSALIRQNPIGYDLGPFFAIREQTTFDADMFERTLKEGPDLPDKLADSFRSRNAATYTLGPGLDFELNYVLMAEDEFDRVFRQANEGAGMWSDFEAMYPGASGVVSFSRVGFDANEDRALALMGYRCGDLCGAGGLYLLVKEDGAWQVEAALYEWMS